MKELVNVLLVIAILLVYVLLNKFFFVNKKFGVANDSMRALAWFYDLQLMHVIATVMLLIYLLFTGQLKVIMYYISDVVNVSGYGKLRMDWFYLEIKFMVVYMIYSTIMESFGVKGTLGKRYVKIVFEEPLGIQKSIIRNLLKPLSIVFWPLLIVVSKMSIDRKWLHDHVVGSKIIIDI